MLFEMALEEYHRSLQLDSASVLALNGYAYAVWEWYLSYRNSDVGREPDWEFALRAERYSREATRLLEELGRHKVERLHRLLRAAQNNGALARRDQRRRKPARVLPAEPSTREHLCEARAP